MARSLLRRALCGKLLPHHSRMEQFTDTMVKATCEVCGDVSCVSPRTGRHRKWTPEDEVLFQLARERRSTPGAPERGAPYTYP